MRKGYCIVAAVVAVYLLTAAIVSSYVGSGWRRFRMNPLRTFPQLLALAAGTAYCPWHLGTARAAYLEIRNRESPCRDEDGVERFRETAILNELIPLAEGKVPSLVIDARLMTMGRLKTLLAAFKREHGPYRVWCTGRRDFVVTALPPLRKGGGATPNVLAEDFMELFEDTKLFKRFASAGVYSPADIFACYLGVAPEVEPAFEGMDEAGAIAAFFGSARLMCRPTPDGAAAPADATRIMPYYVRSPRWILQGTLERAVHTAFTNRVAAVQVARREAMAGFLAADHGDVTNALEHWSTAAKINAHDPLLRNLADSLDLEGRRRLKLGDVNGALGCYQNRIEVFPRDIAAIHNFGICLKKAGHPDAAAQVFMTAAKRDPSRDEHILEFTECAALAGHEEEAMAALKIVMKRHPHDALLENRERQLKAVLARKNFRKMKK